MTVVINGTVGVASPDGSASAPSYTGTSGSTNGMFFPTSTTVAFTANGTEWLRIPSTGGLQVNSSGGGSIKLSPTSTASSLTLTMPAATDTLVARDTTDTLTNKTLTNPTVTNYVETYYNVGTVTSSTTLSLANGTVQTLTLTASTTCTVTMPTATAGKSFVLLVRQAASTGNGAITWSSVKWNSSGTPTVTTTAAKMDLFSFIADGTNWYGSYSQGYTP